MSAGMHSQRTVNVFSGEDVPEYLAVFIGGFGDVWLGLSSRLEKQFSGFLPGVKYASAYYHWNGGSRSVLSDRCGRISEELEQVRRKLPYMPVVLVGHSYGGSGAVEVARRMTARHAVDLCLITIDAVARRQKNDRPEAVNWWGNSYLGEGGGLVEVVPRVGGRWGHCPGADMNLPFSGFQKDKAGNLYSHSRPGPMLYEAPSDEACSLFEAAAAWLEGKAVRG